MAGAPQYLCVTKVSFVKCIFRSARTRSMFVIRTVSLTSHMQSLWPVSSCGQARESRLFRKRARESRRVARYLPTEQLACKRPRDSHATFRSTASISSWSDHCSSLFRVETSSLVSTIVLNTTVIPYKALSPAMDPQDVGRYGSLTLLKARADATVCSYPIDAELLTIGRDAACDIRLYYNAVSPLHCKVIFEERKVRPSGHCRICYPHDIATNRHFSSYSAKKAYKSILARSSLLRLPPRARQPSLCQTTLSSKYTISGFALHIHRKSYGLRLLRHHLQQRLMPPQNVVRSV